MFYCHGAIELQLTWTVFYRILFMLFRKQSRWKTGKENSKLWRELRFRCLSLQHPESSMEILVLEQFVDWGSLPPSEKKSYPVNVIYQHKMIRRFWCWELDNTSIFQLKRLLFFINMLMRKTDYLRYLISKLWYIFSWI